MRSDQMPRQGGAVKSRIVTDNVFPPIPDRSHDWGAFWEGEEEGGYKGYGVTEAEAIRDLIDNHETPDELELVAALAGLVKQLPNTRELLVARETANAVLAKWGWS